MAGIFLGGGDDDYTLTASTDTIIVHAGTGDDTLSGPVLPHSLVLGGKGQDDITLRNSEGIFVAGGNGDDTLRLENVGASVAWGGRGDDTMSSTNDRGIEGNNRLYGGSGDDALTSGASGNKLYGGDGHDTLTAAFAFGNLLDGGRGDDTFVVSGAFFFSTPDTTVEIIGGRGRDTYNFDLGGSTLARVGNDQDGVVSAGDEISGLKSAVDDYQNGEPIHIDAATRVQDPVQVGDNQEVVLQDGEYAIFRGNAGAGLQDAFTVDPGGHDLLLVYDPLGAATTPFVTQVQVVFRDVTDPDWLNFV